MDRVKRGRRLPALVAAVAACTLATAAAEARTPGAQECLLTAPVDTVAFFNTKGGQDWSRVQQYFASAGVSFEMGVSDTRRVSLCGESSQSCQPVLLQVRSEEGARCIQPANVSDGTLRILGMIVARGPGYAPAYGLGTDNYEHIVYLFVRDQTVYALYENLQGQTAFAPAPSGGVGWSFNYETHTDSAHGRPAALWRDKSPADTLSRWRARGGPAAPEWVADEAAQATLQFAWMACAAGCCQFHGTGDGNPFPEDGPGRGHHGNPPPPSPNPNPNPHPARRR